MKFCRVWMPYCLSKVEDEHGGWIPLNRNYKPLGYSSRDWVDYSSVPLSGRIKKLGQKTAIALSWDGAGISERGTVFLYNDGSIPTRSSFHWKSYSEKLKRLAALMTKGK